MRFVITGRPSVEVVDAALDQLAVLEEEVIPFGEGILLSTIEKNTALDAQGLGNLEWAVTRLQQQQLRRTRIRLVSASACETTLSELDEATQRVDSWIEMVRERPADAFVFAIAGLKLLWAGRTQLRHFRIDLQDIRRAQVALVAPPDPPPLEPKPNPGPTGRPSEIQKQLEVYEQIQKLRAVLGREGTWSNAVAEYNRSCGTNFTVAQVTQWGKRIRRFDREFDYGI